MGSQELPSAGISDNSKESLLLLKFYYRSYPDLPKRTLFPLIDIEIFSHPAKNWERISNVLVDTGASVSLLPFSIGALLMPRVKSGSFLLIGGIIPKVGMKTWMHTLKIRIEKMEFMAPVAVAEKEIIPILGRQKAMDRFVLSFYKGKFLTLRK